MIRMTLLEIALFSTPFALFFLYRGFILRHRRAEGEAFDPAPYHLLFMAGGALAFVVFIGLALSQKTVRDVDYIPAHLENGKVIGGKFIEPSNNGDDAKASETHEPANPPPPGTE